ncbi:septum site-determining protein MinC [Leptolyngbya sp. BL0902]|uniref:septum site-determining protein MinC n=1 Tax=Leptolyngbya sp. BL0902 TaxID=1115757 RepID=UPI001934B837|nr:septum site-determining protein MinC [Leptolyngbya sp. BL0902]QQE66457.1 septum site-determining protein MinC [Leptolyngbya sp. BL0902]
MPDFSETFSNDAADTFSGNLPSDFPRNLAEEDSGNVPSDGFGDLSSGAADNLSNDPSSDGFDSDLSNDDFDNGPESSLEMPTIPTLDAAPPPLDYAQTYLKSDGQRLWLALPPDTNAEGEAIPWAAVLQQLRQRLEGTTTDREPQTEVGLQGGDRLLDVRQLQTLAETLNEFALELKRVVTSRRQTALAAVTAGYSVEQLAAVDHLVQTPPQAGRPQADPLYLQTTVRSGVDIRHPGTIVILGDTNPGSALLADGDVIVWGRLRGMAHAGFSGDRSRRIMALQMRPTQLRIADLMARPPEDGPTEDWPEVAYVGTEAIRIARAQDFAKAQLIPGGLGFEDT